MPAAKPAKSPASPTVTLKHLAASLAEGHEVPKKQAEAILNDLVALVVKNLKKGNRIRIVGLGDRDCTVTFDADLHFSLELEWAEENRYGEEPEPVSEHISDYSSISGTAKLRVKDDRCGIENVTFIEIDQSDIEVSEEPW